MIVLGIETSCDETSVAVVEDFNVKSNLISSQEFHSNFGGVVPELSSRAHIQRITSLVKKAITEAEINLKDIDLVASTAGPGLIGALMVGFSFGQGLAYSVKKPFVAVNHIEGHIFSGFLMESKPEFPLLVLCVSGGHTLLLRVKDFNSISLLGTTVDDAVGEAFDKVAKILGLGYPGGPKIQQASIKAVKKNVSFPIAELKNKFDFSFSGLKTAVLRYVQKNYVNGGSISEQEKNEIAFGFETAAVDALIKNCIKALDDFEFNSISVVGGVAANALLRKKITELCSDRSIKCVIPDLKYCGDNGAMIALSGYLRFINKNPLLPEEPFPAINLENYR